MRLPILSAAALFALAPAAFAFQEPAPAPKVDEKPAAAPAAPAAPTAPAAPAKRENKVSAEGQALIDGHQKLAYNPVAAGLKELKGTLVMKMVPPGMEEGAAVEGMPDMSVKFGLVFTAPKTLAVEVSTDNPMLMQMGDQLKENVHQLMMLAMGLLEPSGKEWEIEAASEAGAKVLVIKTFDQGAMQAELRITMNGEGLATKGVVKATDPMSGMEQSIDFTLTYAKEGERYRLEGQSMTLPQFPDPLESKFSYVDAEGIKVLSGISTKGPMGMTFSYKYSDLAINGKKVEIPAEAKKAEPAAAPATPTEPAKPAEEKPAEKKAE